MLAAAGLAAPSWPRCHWRPSPSLVNLYLQTSNNCFCPLRHKRWGILCFLITRTLIRCQISAFCDENVPGQMERWKSLPQTPKPARFTILLSCVCTSSATMGFMEAPSHLKSSSGLLQSPRGPHEGFGESFSFSLSLLPSPRCRKSCGFRGSGQGKAGGWPPPPPDHHLTAARPNNTPPRPRTPRNLKYSLFFCVCDSCAHTF